MLSTLRRMLGLAAQPGPEDGTKKEVRRGLVFGELLIAFLLLAVAISSLTALMYSVTRSPGTSSQAECTDQGSATSPKCVVKSNATTASKLLLAGCATRSGAKVQACNDSLLAAGGTTIRSRTDSASLAMLPKKAKRSNRPDLGFVR